MASLTLPVFLRTSPCRELSQAQNHRSSHLLRTWIDQGHREGESALLCPPWAGFPSALPPMSALDKTLDNAWLECSEAEFLPTRDGRQCRPVQNAGQSGHRSTLWPVLSVLFS